MGSSSSKRGRVDNGRDAMPGTPAEQAGVTKKDSGKVRRGNADPNFRPADHWPTRGAKR